MALKSPEIIIPYYSKSGHTRHLAEAVLAGVHESVPAAIAFDTEKMEDTHWRAMEEFRGIIFGTPTFMGSVAGPYKVFLEETAYRGFWTGQKLMDKLAAGFTVATYPSGDKLSTIIQLFIFAAQHGMIWVNNRGLISANSADINSCGSWAGLMATSVRDKSRMIEESDISDAMLFGKRFADAVKRWNGSQQDPP